MPLFTAHFEKLIQSSKTPDSKFKKLLEGLENSSPVAEEQIKSLFRTLSENLRTRNRLNDWKALEGFLKELAETMVNEDKDNAGLEFVRNIKKLQALNMQMQIQHATMLSILQSDEMLVYFAQYWRKFLISNQSLTSKLNTITGANQKATGRDFESAVAQAAYSPENRIVIHFLHMISMVLDTALMLAGFEQPMLLPKAGMESDENNPNKNVRFLPPPPGKR